MSADAIKLAFGAQLGNPAQIAAAFDLLPNAYFFVKNRSGQFIHANRALVEALGLSFESELVGKTDFDFFEWSLAEEYRAEDRQVMESRSTILDRVWLVPSQSGELNWYLSSKFPLFDSGDEVIGIGGVMRGFDEAGSTLSSYQGMTEAISFVKQNYREKIEVRELAGRVRLSVSQFERRFKSLFQCTPIQYINQVRIHAATQRLIQTHLPIGEIAIDCGFYDQSHFTKLFKRAKGMTPLQYRKRYEITRKGRGI